MILSFFALFLVSAAHADGPRREEAREAVSLIQPQEGDKVHLCVKGDVDITLLNAAGTPVSLAASHINNGDLLGLVSLDGPISLYNIEDKVGANHTGMFILAVAPTLVDIKDIDGDQVPYIQYIPANSGITPCQSTTASAQGYLFDVHTLIVAVTEITPAPEAAPVEDGGVVENPNPAAPDANNDPIALPDANANVPANGGGCSMSASAPNMNFGVGLLFALILGTHALFRFRKE